MHLLLMLILALGTTQARTALNLSKVQLDAEWGKFKTTYSKAYRDAEEEAFRRATWERHLVEIEGHNQEAARGQHTFFMGVNQFADMPNDEFRRLMTGGLLMRDRPRHAALYRPRNVTALPKEVDWRTEGYVTGVKDQGTCGSCWAFSATGALEGQWYKKSGNLVPESEQNLMDCSRDEGNLGCLGGRMDFAYEYIRKNDGVDTESSYPYEEKDDLPCRFKREDVAATDTGFVYIDVGDEEGQKAAVAEVGPIAVAMDASPLSWQLYKSGVYYDKACSSIMLNHAVLAIGYGTTADGEDYWLVKNSWSTRWGDSGYAKMARNRNNACGIATDSLFPTV